MASRYKSLKRKMDSFASDVPLCQRMQEIVYGEGLVLARVAEDLGVSQKNLCAWFGGHVWGADRRGRVTEWLALWDAGEVDLEPLKINKRWSKK